MRSGLPIALLALTACAPPPRPRSTPMPATFAFVDVSLVPMTSERVVPHQTVLVDGGRIVAVGPVDAVSVPPGARRLDGRGRWLMPGLADMHTHLAAEHQLTLFVAYGVTTVRNMWGSPNHLAWRARIERGALLGPRLFTTGPLTDGANPIWDSSRVVTSSAEARAAVAADKAAGYDMVKVYSRLSLESYDALAAAARDAGIPVVGHVPDAVPLEHALTVQRSIEHLTGFAAALQRGGPTLAPADLPSRLRMIDSVDDSRLPALVDAVRRAGVWNCPTLAVKRYLFATGEERAALAARPAMRLVTPVERAMWAANQDFRTRDLEEDAARSERWRAFDRKVVKALADGGAGLLVGTDLGNPYLIAGLSLHEELALLVDAGLTPYQALRAATRDAADFLGVLDEQGTIEPGKRADLLLVSGDPLLAVGAAARPDGVMVAGRWLDAAELAAQIDAVAVALNRPPDRFGGLPALEGAATWEVTWNGTPMGAERLLRRGGALLTQGASDPPYQEKLSSTLAGGSVVYESQTQAGVARLRVDETRLEATLADGSIVSKEARLSPGARLVPATTSGAFAVLGDAAAALAVGARLDVELAQPVAPLDGQLAILPFHVTRLPDEAGARAYGYATEGAVAMSGRWTVASDGLPATIEVKMRAGALRYERR